MTPGENIQRWGWWVDPETGKPAIVKSAHGDYVLASEHEARIAELESEIAEAFRRAVRSPDVQADIARLETRLSGKDGEG